MESRRRETRRSHLDKLKVHRAVSSQAFTRHHGEFSVMGTPSFRPFLKSYWLKPVQMIGQLCEACKSHANTNELERQHKTFFFSAASVPLVGPPPSPGGESIVLLLRQTQRSPHSPVYFPEDCFHPPANIEEFVSFGQEEGDDSFQPQRGRIGRDQSQIRQTARGPQTSKRSSWGSYWRLSRSWCLPGVLQKSLSGVSSTPGISGPHGKLTRGRRPPIFPNVHEQLVKTWSAHQSAHTHSATQAIFSHVDGAEAHGHMSSPPDEETSFETPTGGGGRSSHYVAVKDLCASTDFALMVTKRAAQAVGKAIGFMIVLQRHLWQNLAYLKDVDIRCCWTLLWLPPASLVTPWSALLSASWRPKSAPKQWVTSCRGTLFSTRWQNQCISYRFLLIWNRIQME